MAVIHRLLILGLCMLLVGCTPRSTMSIQLQAHSELNPSAKGESLPVMVRLYQLSSIDAFQHASFQALWKKEQEVLGDSLIQKQEVQVTPNEEKLVKWKQQEFAQYLGVVALFRDTHGQHKTVKSIHQRVRGWPQQHQFTLSGYDIRLTHE